MGEGEDFVSDHVMDAESAARTAESRAIDVSKEAARHYLRAAKLMSVGNPRQKLDLLYAGENYAAARNYLDAIDMYFLAGEKDRARELVPRTLAKETEDANDNAYLEMRLDAGKVKSVSRISLALKAFGESKPGTDDEKRAVANLKRAITERQKLLQPVPIPGVRKVTR